MKPVEDLPGVRRLVAGDPGGGCVPKTGWTYCVYASRKDGSTAHGHFQQSKEVRAFRKQIMAQECKPGSEKIDRSTETNEEYLTRFAAAHSSADPDTVMASLKRAFPIVPDRLLAEKDERKHKSYGAELLVDSNGLQLRELQKSLLTPTKRQIDAGQSKYARNTVELTMTYLKQALRQAFADGKIPRDPTFNVRMPRRDSRDLDGVVTKDQVPTHTEALAILAGAPQGRHGRLLVALGFGCGMRVGEVIGVAPYQVAPTEGKLVIDAQEQRRGRVGPKTRRGVRTIDVPDVVMFELRRALQDRDRAPDVPFFTGPRGGAPRRDEFYDKVWKPALRAAGLAEDRFKFHSARHYCVSSMLERGVSEAEVAEYVGDTVETVRRVYTHFLRDAPPKAKAALDEALGPVPTEGPAEASEAGEAGE